MANHTPLAIDETTPIFSLYPFLPPELRVKTLYYALKKPRIIALVFRDHSLTILSAPHPLFHTTYGTRKRAMRVHSVYSISTPDGSPLIINTETDYLYLADENTLSLVLDPNKHSQIPDKEALGTKLRHLALPLPFFESLLKAQTSPWLPDLFRNFANLEDIVLVAGESSVEALKREVEFVIPRKKNLPRKGPLVKLCMEVFDPWRAFEHLMGLEIFEDAVGKWVAEKHAGNGDWNVPKFRIREVRMMDSKK